MTVGSPGLFPPLIEENAISVCVVWASCAWRLKLKVGVGLMQNWQTSFADKSSDQAMFTSSLLYSF